jgi:hypothetical protein
MGRNKAMDLWLVQRWMAAEAILNALNDLTPPKPHTTMKRRNKNLALQWFKDRDQKPFGYGWCLAVCEVNPNFIRRELNLRLKGSTPVAARGIIHAAL